MRNKKFLFIILIFLFISITGCSVVFSASLTGQFIDIDDDVGINDGIVYFYTKEDNFQDDIDNYNNTGNISKIQNYFSKTNTQNDGGENGSFRINGIMWHSFFSDFGKDGDRKEIFIIFYHEDYGINTMSTYIISNVTNNLAPIKVKTTVTIETYNATVEGVVKISGTNTNGIVVKIYFDEDNDGVADTSDPYRTTTTGIRTIGDTTQDGYYRFLNVEWEDDIGKDQSEMNVIFVFDGTTDDTKVIYSDETNYIPLNK